MAIAAAMLALCAVSGCSTSEIDRLPKEFGGLPEGAPKRSDNPPAYPAVHDMPPTRSKALLDPDEQKRLESDLVATRSRLQNQQKNQVKDSQKQPPAERAAARGDRPTVKRGRKPTALPQADQANGAAPPPRSQARSGQGSGQGREAPPAAAPQPGSAAPAWPAPPGPDATGFGRNP